jgi:Holliday junction resolvase
MNPHGARYKTGYRAERRAIAKLVKQGYFVIRSAGSKTPVDILALRGNEIKLIQVKVMAKKRESELKKAIEELLKIKTHRSWKKELWIWLKGKGFEILKVGI